MHGAEHLLEIFYLLLAAQVMAFIFKRPNQPVVIGEVLAGVPVEHHLVEVPAEHICRGIILW